MYKRPIIKTEYGSCIELQLEFTDSNGDPDDITSDTFSVVHPSTPSLEQANFTVVDGPEGKLNLEIPADSTKDLTVGMTNWFRIQRIMPDGCVDNTEQIWIDVR